MATFKHGNVLSCDYTPGSAVTAGDVVVVGDVALIAHRDIAANAPGALAACGGVYGMTADAAIASGKKAYWNDTADKVTETASGNAHIGFVAPGSSSAADDDPIDIVHSPVDGIAI